MANFLLVTFLVRLRLELHYAAPTLRNNFQVCGLFKGGWRGSVAQRQRLRFLPSSSGFDSRSRHSRDFLTMEIFNIAPRTKNAAQKLWTVKSNKKGWVMVWRIHGLATTAKLSRFALRCLNIDPCQVSFVTNALAFSCREPDATPRICQTVALLFFCSFSLLLVARSFLVRYPLAPFSSSKISFLLR